MHAAVLPAPPGSPAGLFAGIDSTVYRLDSANITGGRYLLAPLKEDGQFAAVFYRPAPTQAWQEVATLPNVEALDTANIDRQGREELLIQNVMRADGSGGGTQCHSLAIYRCETEPRKVFEAPTRYVDEWFGFDGPNTGHYYESTQAISIGYGTIRVGRPRISPAIHCNGYDLCISCKPRLKPGAYALRGDTVVRFGP
ncbi:hypothetical protein [Hymenobacter convexus]|uniref:hypothetical protein n=1 Tax=Hymenobacter sp. CA1UV-4 TaxID=3063782 RepID=UPI0027140456|nr:hypothetical protein [Hymenobacter sp. CA1UV-4]MDO7850294.1 hypothetical protein [Hymenobacter sp. CA1UV-4]